MQSTSSFEGDVSCNAHIIQSPVARGNTATSFSENLFVSKHDSTFKNVDDTDITLQINFKTLKGTLGKLDPLIHMYLVKITSFIIASNSLAFSHSHHVSSILSETM